MLRTASASRAVLYSASVLGTAITAYAMWLHNGIESAPDHEGRRNPFRGLPGCAYLQAHAAPGPVYWPFSSGHAIACDGTPVAPTAMASLDPLKNVLAATVAAPATATPGGAGPTRTLAGRVVAQGRGVALTLDADRQTAAQDLLGCATQSLPEACTRAGITPATWADHYEGAAAQAIGLAEIDIGTGGIRVLASAHSPCFQAHWLKESQATSPVCPPMPPIDAAQPWRLDHHALYTLAMPGSILKPLEMTTLLSGPDAARYLDSSGREWVRDTLMRSDSVAVLNALMCAERGSAGDCRRLTVLPSVAQALGWDGESIELVVLPSEGTGGVRLIVPGGRVFQDRQQGHWRWMSTAMPNAQRTRDCARARWAKCSGEDVARVVSELWGQGSAQVTPLAAARMAAHLASIAREQRPPRIHVVAAGAGDGSGVSRSVVAPAHARLVLDGMSYVHRGGTASAACRRVYGTAAACVAITWLAGKTGTPQFVLEDMTADERARHCAVVREAAAPESRRLQARQRLDTQRCAMLPHKWFVALVRDDDRPDAPYTRAIAVLAQRTYLANGVIDSRGDVGINVAAEVALRYIRATRPGARAP